MRVPILLNHHDPGVQVVKLICVVLGNSERQLLYFHLHENELLLGEAVSNSVFGSLHHYP